MRLWIQLCSCWSPRWLTGSPWREKRSTSIQPLGECEMHSGIAGCHSVQRKHGEWDNFRQENSYSWSEAAQKNATKTKEKHDGTWIRRNTHARTRRHTTSWGLVCASLWFKSVAASRWLRVPEESNQQLFHLQEHMKHTHTHKILWCSAASGCPTGLITLKGQFTQTSSAVFCSEGLILVPGGFWGPFGGIYVWRFDFIKNSE